MANVYRITAMTRHNGAIIASREIRVDPWSVAALTEFFWECSVDERHLLPFRPNKIVVGQDWRTGQQYTGYQTEMAKQHWRKMLALPEAANEPSADGA